MAVLPDPYPHDLGRTPMPVPSLPDVFVPRAASALAKWLAVAGLLGGALYHATAKPPDYATAYTLFMAALGAAGISATLHRSAVTSEVAAAAGLENAAKLRVVAADVENVRNNPAMPGTPLTAQDKLDRRD